MSGSSLGVKAVSSGGTDACSGTRTITTLFSNRDDCVAPACWAAIKQGTSTVVTLHGLFDQKRREGRARVRSSSDSRTVFRHERVAHCFDILGFRGIPSGAYPRLDVLGRKVAELVTAVGHRFVNDLGHISGRCRGECGQPFKPLAGVRDDRVIVARVCSGCRLCSTARGEICAQRAAGLDDLYSDAERRQFVGQGLRKTFQGEFACAVERNQRQCEDTGP